MGSLNHSSRAHALLSASGASRWLNCTPSARFEQTNGAPDKGSQYAQEGTLAHELAELELRRELKLITKTKYTRSLNKIKADPLYSEEMPDYVEEFVRYVLERISEFDEEPIVLLESRLDLTDYVPESFGTGDVIIIGDGLLVIIDLKYGKGVRVDAVNNNQLRLYGLGAYTGYGLLYDVSAVEMVVHQPRMDHISAEALKLDDLLSWAETFVRPRAKLAFDGEGEFKPGDHCRWCKAKHNCRALAEHVNESAKHEFAPASTLSDEELLQAVEVADRLSDWINSVKSHMLDAALEGKVWPGLKVVEGRTQRRWAAEEQAISKLVEAGFEKEEVTNTKIKGIGEIERLVSKPIFKDQYGSFVIKPEGKPTLAPDSDKRPPFNPNKQAQEVFK